MKPENVFKIFVVVVFLALVLLVAIALSGCVRTTLPDGFSRTVISIPFWEGTAMEEYNNLYVDPSTGAEHEISYTTGIDKSAERQVQALEKMYRAGAAFYGVKTSP